MNTTKKQLINLVISIIKEMAVSPKDDISVQYRKYGFDVWFFTRENGEIVKAENITIWKSSSYKENVKLFNQIVKKIRG